MAKKERVFNGEAYRLKDQANLKKSITWIEKQYVKAGYKTKIVKKDKHRDSVPLGSGKIKLPPARKYFLYVSYRKKNKKR